MGQLHQMQIGFVPEQDRLLFRINTTGRQQQEFRFWLTRRYVRILWKALLNMLKSRESSEVVQFKEEPTKSAVLQLEHQEATSKADFQTPYQEANIHPLGEDPILVSKVALKKTPNGGQQLSMHPSEGQGIDFNLDVKVLHSFCRLLADAAAKAEWDLNLDFSQAEELIDNQGLN